MSTHTSPPPLRVAIVGTGNIGTDLLLKVEASPLLECVLFAGRRAGSPGIELAERHGVPTSVAGIDAVTARAENIDLVCDATSADDATRHWSVVAPTGLPFVDLTPAHLGKFCVPALNLDDCLDEQYLSMVTCGGQAAVPMAHCMAEAAEGIDYLEIVSASASATVGPASRANLDEYVHTTEQATIEFCGVRRTKTVLVINPAEPGIVMRNSIAVTTAERIDMDALRASVAMMEKQIRSYVPGYRVVVPPVAVGDRITITVEVEGRGDWFPRYAGNLDIITCAALAVAEARAERRRS
ncbi:acetaldehyde dehydrogenase (acetylating) [Micromonospora sp. AMSO12t]|uniref:acetaldehyde dehydrogenase (acetylating) n=1 Tax=Micromonospora sp. AMSO12t TaxID=2650410 RepID=UPI00124B5721|nr:acetaldehyde dehydrogenase (acetylating) [Micromonospora sp. AMSO12t]KAB1159145.1 acetaldehyde dehydrogenase (acetylating) [Micromonospora sp. AMSO12t]